MKLIFLFVILFTLDGLSASYAVTNAEDQPRRHITFYNTYGYVDGDDWVIPARVWVNKKRRSLQGFVNWLINLTNDYTEQEIDILHTRLRDIVANSKSRKTVTIRVQDAPNEYAFRIRNRWGEEPRTNRNGIIEGEIRIPVELAERFLEYQQSDNGWLTVEARSGLYRGTGYVQLIEPEGLSVISDIDDTVKITEIPAGARVVVHNTFFKEYAGVPGMADMYAELEGAAFHYVSGSPWQLYNPLTSFLFGQRAGFPRGTMHMKNARKNPLTISSWRDMMAFITNENLTFEQKVGQIATIFEHFPNRRFIMVGDSGERDPEVYRTILENYPDQVERIYIRDVINDRELNPKRLTEMTIIPAPTIYRPGEVQLQEITTITRE